MAAPDDDDDAQCDISSLRIDGQTPAVTRISAAVDELYRFRDYYLDSHGLAHASRKEPDLAEELKKVLALIDTCKDTCNKNERARFSYLWGRALNVTAAFDADALTMLKKAVKLDYKLVDAWHELGECFWKKGDVGDARNCFEAALRQGPNKVALRSMSMVLRQLPCPVEEKRDQVLQSFQKAKEAVNLDVGDGMSWLILGNACLTAFFTLGQDPKFLRQCLAAYQQACADPVVRNNQDLHYNRAIALKYEEDYQGALEGFRMARMLDPAWAEAKSKETDLVAYLRKVDDLVRTKGHTKPKRLRSLAAALGGSRHRFLGPYAGAVPLEPVALGALRPGANPGKVVLGKVVGHVWPEDPVPFMFGVVDEQLTCCSVTVYNSVEKQFVFVGDAVAIPEPFMQPVSVQHDDTVVCYNNIRVDSPAVLVVNSRKLGLDKHVSSQVGFTAPRQPPK